MSLEHYLPAVAIVRQEMSKNGCKLRFLLEEVVALDQIIKFQDDARVVIKPL